ncbi:MAG: hypothetical protein E6J00_12715 [Chloroflexi bacterium]|nr:MAG: hypothetical protein E6J00_12715 [Chloroflexota bacterium]
MKPETYWDAASWLFYWVVNDLSTTVRNEAAVGKLKEIERQHLPSLRIKDLPAAGRSQVLEALCRSLVDHANRALPTNLPNRDDVLRHLGSLAALACNSFQPDSVTG